VPEIAKEIPPPVTTEPGRAVPAPTPSQEWFYLVGTRRHGPMSLEELASALRSSFSLAETASVLVWREGMETWREARTVPEVSSRLARGPMTNSCALDLGQALEIMWDFAEVVGTGARRRADLRHAPQQIVGALKLVHAAIQDEAGCAALEKLPNIGGLLSFPRPTALMHVELLVGTLPEFELDEEEEQIYGRWRSCSACVELYGRLTRTALGESAAHANEDAARREATLARRAAREQAQNQFGDHDCILGDEGALERAREIWLGTVKAGWRLREEIGGRLQE
jgi:hypothetical protein